MDLYALFIALRVTALLITITTVGAVAIWALIQLVARLGAPRRSSRPAWLHPRLWFALLVGALVANLFDLLVRRAPGDLIGSLVTLLVTEIIVVTVWEVTGRIAARELTWQPDPALTLRIGTRVIPDPTAPEYLEHRRRVAQVVLSIPVDRFRLGPVNLVQADRIALSIDGSDDMIRVAWLKAMAHHKGLRLTDSLTSKLLPREQQLLRDLKYLQSLSYYERMTLHIGAHGDGAARSLADAAAIDAAIDPGAARREAY